MMRADSMEAPGAALARVLAMITLAYSTAFGGRSRNCVWLSRRASASALLVAPPAGRPF